MKKKLIIKFNNGVIYEIFAQIIAEHRAAYYAKINNYEIGTVYFIKEVESLLDDEVELYNWVQNSMNWEELQFYGKYVTEIGNKDLFEEWKNGNYTLSVNY